jgi:hypothetical protein
MRLAAPSICLIQVNALAGLEPVAPFAAPVGLSNAAAWAL